MSREYVPSIDWLKTIGLTLIVFGHVADAAVLTVLPPIYPKQIGVALFLYAAGYGLALERRSGWQVMARRLFDVYLFGLAAAVLLSIIGYFHDGNVLESNYLPFFGGVNVALDYFPANPTTWFIGAYLHILLVWALVLRRVEIRGSTVAMILAGEMLVRAALIQSAGAFVAYMNVSNWITVFALGLMEGGRRDVRPAPRAAWVSAGLLLGFVAIWTTAFASIPRRMDFPFMMITVPAPWDVLATSAAVSTLYLLCTVLTVRAVGPLPAPGVVRFVARHTLIVFIGHMPVYYAMQPLVTAVTSAYWGRVFLHLIVCYLGLLLLSAAIHWAMDRIQLRDRIFGVFTPAPVRVPEVSV
jgi:peptidoglycan/LPS O-acetylase OafA/YrhL